MERIAILIDEWKVVY